MECIGAVAQLGERYVRNVQVSGSIPLCSILIKKTAVPRGTAVFAFGVDLRLTGFSAAGENIAHHIDEVGHGYIAVTVNITHLEWTWCFA